MTALTALEIAIVQQTWDEVEMVADNASQVFYARLFAIDPESAMLFAETDMRKQREKLMITLKEVVANLPHLKRFNPTLAALGDRHTAYGVKRANYETVGEALLWTLEKVLGPGFTPDVQSAWTKAYGLISSAMLGERPS